MGSGSSRLEARRWEKAAQRKIQTTKNIGKVEVICSLIPGVDEVAMVSYLKGRSDLDILFALYCRYEDLSKAQRAELSSLSAEFKADELWRVFQMPLETIESPWDWNWQLPIEGDPSEIAIQFHAAVCQATSRIPFSDFVKYALGYTTKAGFLNNLLHVVNDIRDELRTEFLDRPQMKELYIDIERALKQRHHPLAHWIVASSLHHSIGAPYDTLAPNLEPIRAIFAKRDFDLVLTRLAALDRRFAHCSQMYNSENWSTDLHFWQCVDKALWSGKMTTPVMSPDLSREDWDGFEDRADSSWRKVVFSMKGLRGRNSQYTVKKGLLSMGLLNDSPQRS